MVIKKRICISRLFNVYTIKSKNDNKASIEFIYDKSTIVLFHHAYFLKNHMKKINFNKNTPIIRIILCRHTQAQVGLKLNIPNQLNDTKTTH